MAAGEYVSVSSQADTERADLALERKGLEANEIVERDELAGIYVKRGLDLHLAKEVAEQLMAHDALAEHARDELGISDTLAARPLRWRLQRVLDGRRNRRTLTLPDQQHGKLAQRRAGNH